MDFRYLNYLVPNEKYYVPRTEKEKEDEGLHLNIPQNWIFSSDEHWKIYLCKGVQIPRQGWKIHVSSTVKHARETLELISNYLFESKIPFKHVTNLRELLMKNSKYGDRSSSGKFMTIYPQTETQFVELLDELSELIDHLPRGPYILSDKRWKNSNIFFRYGAFAEIYTTINGEQVLAIEDESGNLIPDHRGTSYSLPSFIEEPEAVKEMSLEQNKIHAEIDSELSNYDITSALHFSNGGGVYLATDKRTNDEVVIKEGRPNAGLDGAGRDAIKRLKHEAKMLEKLSDVSFVVDLKGEFDEWEHKFIVQEYIEGTTLHSWLAAYYPFSEKEDSKEFTETAISIIKQTIDALKKIHSKGIGMGDLQPNNIMVTLDKKIKIIDFEAASHINDKKHPGLATPGFVGKSESTREQADWFALLRIARHAFIPIGPVQDLAESILEKHDAVILEKFGRDAYNLVKEIEDICAVKGAKAVPSILSSPSKHVTLDDIPVIIEKLRNGIIKDLSNQSRLLPGDIRQYEFDGGFYNAYTGGAGVLSALSHTGEVPIIAIDWAKEYLVSENLSELNDGLLSGKAGIAGVLCQIGLKQEAKQIFNAIEIHKDFSDITLYSGLSGIGLSLLSASELFGDESFYAKSLKVADRLTKLIKEDPPIMKDDLDTITKGLIHGWSGVSLFFTVLYNYTGDAKWLEHSRLALQKDLDQSVFVEVAQYYQIKDDARHVPYLAGGSGGVGLAMIHYKEASKKDKIWHDELHGIGVAANSKTFYSPGLFRGLGGLISTADAIDRHFNLNKERGYLKGTFSVINLYLLKQDNCYYIPGDYNYRVSGDLFSGAAGILIALNDLNKRRFSWLPLPEYKIINMTHPEKVNKQTVIS